MTSPKNILILYTKAGGGHLSLAKAMQEALLTYYPKQFQVQLLDPFSTAYSSSFELLTQLPDLYKAYWHTTNNNPKLDILKEINSLMVQDTLTRYIATFRPDLIILNQGQLADGVETCIKKSGLGCKFAIQIHDPFTPHGQIFSSPLVDLYLSPTPETTQSALRHGVPASKIQTVGWITRRSFFAVFASPALVKRILGLDPTKFTIFIGGAGQSHPKILKLCRLLSRSLATNSNVQIIINTGFSTSYMTDFIRMTLNQPHLFFLLPYSSNIAEIISACDLVIGKAGPNFIFECIHLGKPPVIIGHLPGHEDGNLAFVTDSNLGWVEEDLDQAATLITRLVANPSQITAKKPNLKKVSQIHRHADKNIAQAIANLW